MESGDHGARLDAAGGAAGADRPSPLSFGPLSGSIRVQSHRMLDKQSTQRVCSTDVSLEREESAVHSCESRLLVGRNVATATSFKPVFSKESTETHS